MSGQCSNCGDDLKVLFNLTYCPNDCDKKQNNTWTEYKDTGWFYKELKEGDPVPKNALRGWWTSHDPLEWAFELADAPGWEISGSYSRDHMFDKKGDTLVVPAGRTMVVFKEKSI